MKRDGEILVDGAIPWNSSQTWSDSATGPFTEAPASVAFNGEVVYNGSPAIAPNGDPVMFSGSYPVTKGIRVFTWFNGNGGANIKIQGSNGQKLQAYNNLSESSAGWHWIPYNGTITEITMAISTNQTRFCGIDNG